MSSTETEPSPKILLVDDDTEAAAALVRALLRQDARPTFHTVHTAAEALALAETLRPEAAIVDLTLDPKVGPKSGLALLSDLLQLDSSIRVLVLTGHGADEFGMEAMNRGAASFLEKPADTQHLLALLRDGVSYSRMVRNYNRLSSTPAHLAKLTGLSTRNPRMQEVLEAVAYAATNNQPLLLLGETGTGKGVIAQAVHTADSRKAGPFIRFQPNYGGQDMVASELFGHTKGAYTGATEERRGLIETANRGTLFIDEVDELPAETQVMLLHVLQEKMFRRIGSTKEHRSDFRLIAATNRSLDEIRQGKKVRPDFYHRIAHFALELPPLRERPEDIPDLANFFVLSLANRENLQVQGLTPAAMLRLGGYSWPGNIRELQAVVEGGVYRAHFYDRQFIEPPDLSISKVGTSGGAAALSFRERVNLFELQLVRETLKKCHGNQKQAADTLTLDRGTLRRILKRDPQS